MISYLITCTNPTCAITEEHRQLFAGQEDLLSSSQGWEPGALNLAQGLSMKFRSLLIHGDVTRLLIDLEQDGESRWSSFSIKIPEKAREKLVIRYEVKYRNAIQTRLSQDLSRCKQVIHFLIHTAPLPDGQIRIEHEGSPFVEKIAKQALKGLPLSEVHAWVQTFEEKSPFVDWLIKNFSSENYGLIRLTVSQSFFLRSKPMRWDTIKKSIIHAFFSAVEISGHKTDLFTD